MSKRNDMKNLDLSSLRDSIDELDQKIVELLNQRAEVVVSVGKAKRSDGTAIYAPDREQRVLQRIAKLNKGPLPQKTLHAIYLELMSGSFALEKPLRIGFLGPDGSYSHMAASRKFGASVDYLPLPDFQAIFNEVARGHCDLGVVPIENSLGGGVIGTMDCFIDSQIHICGEVVLEIHHNLLANCELDKIKLIASKPEVFAQCRNWIATSLGGVEMIPTASSSKAAQMASTETNLAAIGSKLASELYGLKIVFANIEDNPNNQTRFFVISKTPAKRTGQDKTAILFTTAHRSGALVEALNIFAKHKVNLTNIDTRPSKRQNWEYFFFVDAEGHIEDDNLIAAIDELKPICSELLVLGSFPKATAPL